MLLARSSRCCAPAASNSLQIYRSFAIPWRKFFNHLKEDTLKVKEKKVLDDDNSRYADDEYHFMPMGESDIQTQASVSFLSQTLKKERLMSIRTISKVGFRTQDKNFLIGPIAIFPKTALSWRVLTPDHITPESLELFFLLQPKLDVLIIGVGDRKDIDPVRKRIVPTLQQHQIGFEITTTDEAIYSFNFLNGLDNRYVAAALFPPSDLRISPHAYAQTMLNISEGKATALQGPDSWLHMLDGLDPVKTVCERIWGYSPEANHALKVINALREEKLQIRAERLEEKILKDQKVRRDAIVATAEKRRLEAEKEEEEEEKKRMKMKKLSSKKEENNNNNNCGKEIDDK